MMFEIEAALIKRTERAVCEILYNVCEMKLIINENVSVFTGSMIKAAAVKWYRHMLWKENILKEGPNF